MKHITSIPLYIRSCNTSLKGGADFVKIPAGTELIFVKYGDESISYSSDPVHANCYSGNTENFNFQCKFLYTDPKNIWSLYDGNTKPKNPLL